MQQSRDDQSRVLGTSMVVEGIFLFRLSCLHMFD